MATRQKPPCIICGKASEICGMCSTCWLKRQVLFTAEDFEIRICECGSYLSHGKWKPYENMDDMIKSEVREHIRSPNSITSTEIKLRIVGNKVRAFITCTGTIKPCDSEKTETAESGITIRTVKCDECKKHLASYYEAVIQLRVQGKDGEMILESILKEAGASAINTNVVQGGVDVIMFKDNVAKKIAGSLRKKGYSITKSNVFVVQKNNKKIYRNYYSVKKGV